MSPTIGNGCTSEKCTDQFVAMRALMFPLGSKLSNWLINSTLFFALCYLHWHHRQIRHHQLHQLHQRNWCKLFSTVPIQTAPRPYMYPYRHISGWALNQWHGWRWHLCDWPLHTHSILPVPGGPKRGEHLWEGQFWGWQNVWAIQDMSNLQQGRHKQCTWSNGVSMTSCNFSICSLQPLTSE